MLPVRAEGRRMLHKDINLKNKVNHGPSLRKLKIVHVGICRAKAVKKSLEVGRGALVLTR